MTVRDYKLARFGRVEYVYLCDTHVEARRVLGWAVLGKRKSISPYPRCRDCGAAKDTVLAAIVADAEAQAAADEPKAPPILPGQEKLFD